MMFSKHVYMGVLAAATAMTMIACQKSFNMTCTDPKGTGADKNSICAPAKNSVTVNTVIGAVNVSNVTALAIPMSQDGAGSNGGLKLSFNLSVTPSTGANSTSRQIDLSIPAAGNGTGDIQNNPNEPAMRYSVRCSGSDPTCATMDVGIYIKVSAQEVKVYALRVNGSNILTTAFVPVGGNVVQDDPTSALNAYPSI